MNIKSIALLVSAMALLGACGGDKQDANIDAAGGTAFVTRYNENVAQGAFIEADFKTTEEAKAYVEANANNIEWVNIDDIAQDDEFQFSQSDDKNLQQTARGPGHGRRGHAGRGPGRHGRPGYGRPSHLPHRPGYGRPGRPGRPGYGRSHRRFKRHRHHHWHHWPRRWKRPRYRYWGYRCGLYRIMYRGYCARPYSPYYGNTWWDPYYGWNGGFSVGSSSGWWFSLWYPRGGLY